MITRKAIFKAKRIKPEAGGKFRSHGGVVKIRRDYAADWEELRIKVFIRDGWACRRCAASLRGNNRRHVHHILELSRGGTNAMSNLISLCNTCHEKQHKHKLRGSHG